MCSPGISQGLKLNARPSAAVLDNINAVGSPLTAPSIHLSGSEAIVFTGWAVDEPSQAVAGGVDIVIDQMAYSAVYGTERKDVAAHFNNQAVRNSGFRFDLPGNTLKRGSTP